MHASVQHGPCTSGSMSIKVATADYVSQQLREPQKYIFCDSWWRERIRSGFCYMHWHFVGDSYKASVFSNPALAWPYTQKKTDKLYSNCQKTSEGFVRSNWALSVLQLECLSVCWWLTVKAITHFWQRIIMLNNHNEKTTATQVKSLQDEDKIRAGY